MAGSDLSSIRSIPLGFGKRHVEVNSEQTETGPSIHLATVQIPYDMVLKGMLLKKQKLYITSQV